jgi:V/A-type H+/Na+-transporting ATPase subunit E
MAEELKELLEKIQREGIDAAEAKGSQIEAQARRRADDIIKDAQKEASRLVAEARERVLSAEESGKQALQQAARDMLISLRKEIGFMLDKIVASHIHQSLGSAELTRIILALIKEAGAHDGNKIIVSMKAEDLKKLENVITGELSAEIRKGVVFKHSGDIKGGFTISYDAGRSYYDFTDRALAEYVSAYLKPHLSKVLIESAERSI